MVISLKMYCNINIYMASFWNSHYSNHLQCLQVISNATTLPVDVVLQDSCHILIMYPLFHPFLDKAEQILVLGSLLNKNFIFHKYVCRIKINLCIWLIFKFCYIFNESIVADFLWHIFAVYLWRFSEANI